jgi:hypothetical protein
MSTLNSKWPVWSFASFAKHFDTNKQSVFLYVDGTDRDTADLKDFAEFRLDGPRIKQISRRDWHLEVTVNILVQSTMDDSDAYKLQRTVGIMVAAFTPTIIGYEYGDSGNEFACFQLLGGSGNILGFDVRINNFGIIDDTVRKMQATVEGRYRAELVI